MSDLFTRSRTVILRNWRELSPKLAVGLLTGSVTGFALDLAAQNHIALSPTAQHLIVVIGFFVGGYIKSETFPSIQDIARDLPKADAVADTVDRVIHPPLPDAHTQPVKIVPTDEKLSMADIIKQANSQPIMQLPPTSEDDTETQVLPSPSGPFMGSRFGA